MRVYVFQYLGTEHVIDIDGTVWRYLATERGIREYEDIDAYSDPAFAKFIEEEFA
jgi:hypothetical protein